MIIQTAPTGQPRLAIMMYEHTALSHQFARGFGNDRFQGPEPRRECVDNVAVLGERHLCHLLKSYQRYYNDARTHLSLNKDAPVARAVQAVGNIVAKSLLGGLHHRYVRI